MQFRVIVVTDPHIHKHIHTQTHRQDRLQYTVPLSLAPSVNERLVIFREDVGGQERVTTDEERVSRVG